MEIGILFVDPLDGLPQLLNKKVWRRRNHQRLGQIVLDRRVEARLYRIESRYERTRDFDQFVTSGREFDPLTARS